MVVLFLLYCITNILFYSLNGTAHEILVLIISASNEDLYKSTHSLSLTRAFAVRTL